MADTSHRRQQEVFVEALELPVAERAAFVARACGGDTTLRDRVLALLAKATDDDTFLDAPLPVVALAGASGSAPLALAVADRIGPYELVRRLGEGGFGAVWEARQHEPVARLVALKVLKLGMDTEQVVARFAQERQALACLDHPGIARVLDAGATATGRPFFVMELVDGAPLVEFCDERRLPLRDRLHLFAQVCDAVQHAHGRGIIHRDLKPSNVLVAERDGTAQVKVIDFGIAKAIGRKLTERTLLTEATQVIGTLEYMSPEQAGGSADIDIRADVWSLGVMLYELLTGRTPFAAANTADDWRGELLRRLQETEPLRPSTELARAGDRLAELAGRRRTTGQRLGAQVRGELDWIVMKALERDRARRYATANDLAADVRRHLAGEPIVAAPPGAGYRLRKFVRRHRGLVAAGATILFTLAGGLVSFAWQAGVSRDQRDRAVLERAHSEQVQQLVLDALGSADPIDGGDQGALVVDAMARAGALLDDGRLADQPEVELGLRLTIAGVQCNNGAPQPALAHAERAMVLARRLFPEDHERLVTAGNHVARALRDVGRSADEEPVRREALAMARRLWPEGHGLLVQTMQQYATCLHANGRMVEGDALLQECAAMAKRVFPGDHWVVAGLCSELGHAHFAAGRPQSAEPFFRDAVAMATRLAPDGHPRTARFLANLAMTLSRLERRQEAESSLRAALAMTERAFPGDHPDVVSRRGQLGMVLRDLGRIDEALPLFEQALAMSRRLFAGDHPRTAGCLEQIGDLKATRGDAEGEQHLAEAVAMRRRLHHGDHPELAQVIARWAEVAQRFGKGAAAEAELQEALAMTRRLFPGDHDDVRARLRDLGFHHWSTRQYESAAVEFGEALAMARRLHAGDSILLVDCLDDLGSALLGKGERAEAAKHFDEALAMQRRLPGSTPGAEARLLHKVVQALVARGPDAAAEVTARVGELRAMARRDLPADAGALLRILRLLAGTVMRGGRADLAEAVVADAVGLARRMFPNGHVDLVVCLEEQGFVAMQRGQPNAAIDAFTAALAMAEAAAPGDAELRARLQKRLDEARRAAK